MSDRTAAPARPPARTQRARRESPVSGRLVVGEYVGQLAADAAQAVRRAGLKPGLDRSFECEPELLGQVVAQEPVAGSDLARNGMVTLYVAAPGAAAVAEDTDTDRGREPDPGPVSPGSPLAAEREGDSEAPQRSRVRRRRKPGLATRDPQLFDRPLDPAPSDRGLAGEAQTDLEQVPLTQESASEVEFDAAALSDGEEDEETVFDDQMQDELSDEELVVHADDVFAGRANTGFPVWRRAYPGRRKARARGASLAVRVRLAEHPWLVRTAGVMLVVWALVAVAAMLAGHSPRANHQSIVAGVVQHTSAVWVHTHVRPRLLRVQATRPARRHLLVRVRPRPWGAPSPTAPAVSARRPVTRPVAAAAVPAPVVDRAPSGSVAAAREFGPEQHGGPFSP
jgi:hypothetical protein